MITAQVVETSVTVNQNSPIQDYVHPDDHTQPTLEKVMKIRWSPKKNVLTFYEIVSTISWRKSMEINLENL